MTDVEHNLTQFEQNVIKKELQYKTVFFFVL